MPLAYRILAYLENSIFVVAEVERPDRPSEHNLSRRFCWLLFHKASTALWPLESGRTAARAGRRPASLLAGAGPYLCVGTK